MHKFIYISSFTLASIALVLPACKSGRIQEEPQRVEMNANLEGKGTALFLDFQKGSAHNHPSFVMWAEKLDGQFIQTLLISKAVGTSVYQHGDPSSGHWEPGEIRRPASLPYWAHRRNVKSPDGLLVPSLENPVADAYTGATPAGDFGVHDHGFKNSIQHDIHRRYPRRRWKSGPVL